MEVQASLQDYILQKNLVRLKEKDGTINSIELKVPFVALYEYIESTSTAAATWTKRECEGTLFLVKHNRQQSSETGHGNGSDQTTKSSRKKEITSCGYSLVILNQKSRKDYIQEISANMECSILPESTQFLVFKVGATMKNQVSESTVKNEAQIIGLWVHDEKIRKEIYETLHQYIALERHISYFNATGVLPPSFYVNKTSVSNDLENKRTENDLLSTLEESNRKSNLYPNEHHTSSSHSKLHQLFSSAGINIKDDETFSNNKEKINSPKAQEKYSIKDPNEKKLQSILSEEIDIDDILNSPIQTQIKPEEEILDLDSSSRLSRDKEYLYLDGLRLDKNILRRHLLNGPVNNLYGGDEMKTIISALWSCDTFKRGVILPRIEEICAEEMERAVVNSANKKSGPDMVAKALREFETNKRRKSMQHQGGKVDKGGKGDKKI